MCSAPQNEMFKFLKHIDPSVQSYDGSVDRKEFFVKCAIRPVVGLNADGNMNFLFFSVCRLF